MAQQLDPNHHKATLVDCPLGKPFEFGVEGMGQNCWYRQGGEARRLLQFWKTALGSGLWGANPTSLNQRKCPPGTASP